MNTFRTFLLSCLLVCVALLTGCAPSPSPLQSAWPTRLVLAQAEQTAAPALTVSGGRVFTAWIGADANGVHQDARVWDATGAGAVTVLPLPPVHPYGQQLFPAGDGGVHLLWLDADADGVTQVYSALLSAKLDVLRGPTPLTTSGAWRYAAYAAPDGTLWVVSSGGNVSEPSLTVHEVDAQARPRLQDQPAVVPDADWPTLRRAADGTLWLYGLRLPENRVWVATLTDGQVSSAQAISDSPVLNAGDRLEGFRVGQDGAQQYLFWDITRANGERESWWTRGAFAAESLPPPERLRVEAGDSLALETGFAGGQVESAQIGGEGAVWVTPLDSAESVLPAAALLSDGQLGVVYFRDGTLVGMQRLGVAPTLLGLPMLVADGDAHLYLTVAEAGESTAALMLYSTRTQP